MNWQRSPIVRELAIPVLRLVVVMGLLVAVALTLTSCKSATAPSGLSETPASSCAATLSVGIDPPVPTSCDHWKVYLGPESQMTGHLDTGPTPNDWVAALNAEHDNSSGNLPGSQYHYIAATPDYAVRWFFQQGALEFDTAPIGTKGDVVKFAQVLTLDSNRTIVLPSLPAAPTHGMQDGSLFRVGSDVFIYVGGAVRRLVLQ